MIASKGVFRMEKRQLFAVIAGVTFAAASVFAAGQAAKKPRVFFIEPKNNATVTSPVHMKFGSEGITIAAVPAGEITTARPGMAHYHVGIDQDCLPAGKNIVKGTPSWVPFGEGKDVFDSQLTPGKHTLPGTCQVITVNVK